MKEDIILNNLGLIYKVMKDMHCNTIDKEQAEEFYFEGLIGLMEASKTYDKAKGNSGYLYKAIRLKIFNVFKRHTRQKRYCGYTPISLNTNILASELIDYIPDNHNFEQEFIVKDYVKWLLSRLKDTMYKQYLKEYYGIDNPQLNIYEIAKKYNTSYQYIQQCVKKGIAMLRKEIENEEKNFKIKTKMGSKFNKKKHEIT